MSMSSSPQGRRVLVAPVTGRPGARIQAWRELHDPEQALRLPPHATLCYSPPAVDPAVMEAQVRHAFPSALTVRLGSAQEFANYDHTFYVPVLETAALDAARVRLFDASSVALDGPARWTWHVTCLRYGRTRNLEEVRRAAAELAVECIWRLDTIAYLELRGKRYETVAEWRLQPAPQLAETSTH